MTKAIWKFGPIWPNEILKVMGRPVSFGEQGGNFYVWTEVDPAWKDLPNTKEADAQVEWHSVTIAATGVPYEGKYLDTVHIKGHDGYPYVFHLIEV